MSDERRLLMDVPAVTTSSAKAFPLGLTERSPHRWLLTSAHGSLGLRVDLRAPVAQFRLRPVVIEPIDPESSMGFVEDLAAWLGVGPIDGIGPRYRRPRADLIGLGAGREGSGMSWQGFKLVLTAQEGKEPTSAELFFRVNDGRDQAQLLQKWSEYATRLPALLEATCHLPPRAFERLQRPPALPPRQDEQVFRLGQGVFVYPKGWTIQEGSTPTSRKIHDPPDDMAFEVSLVSVGPAPSAAWLLARMLEKPTAPPQEPLEVRHLPSPPGRPELAVGEHTWTEPDTSRGGAVRLAGCRWLVALRDQVMLLVTLNYWADDAAVAVPIAERAAETLAF